MTKFDQEADRERHEKAIELAEKLHELAKDWIRVSFDLDEAEELMRQIRETLS